MIKAHYMEPIVHFTVGSKKFYTSRLPGIKKVTRRYIILNEDGTPVPQNTQMEILRKAYLEYGVPPAPREETYVMISHLEQFLLKGEKIKYLDPAFATDKQKVIDPIEIETAWKTIANEFQFILDSYIDGSTKVDSSKPTYKSLTKTIPSLINFTINRFDIKVKGSMGQGNKTPYPWVSILNKSMTETSQKGIYVVYLFKKDMSGFYLTLNQGITNFEDLYHARCYEYAEKVSNYFRVELDDKQFSNGLIKLGDGKKDQGYGYERTTILSKYYPSNKFDWKTLKFDLDLIIKDYDEIIKHCQTFKYDDVIKNVVGYDSDNRLVTADEAIQSIKEALEEEGSSAEELNKTLVEQIPLIDRSKKFKRITTPVIRKIDYIKKAKSDAQNGTQGEQLVLSYETQRLRNFGRPDLADKVKWDAQISDTLGYDISSYDIDKNGKEFEIKIEVKTTQSKVDTEFLVSKNEVETSKKYKDKYCVYRVYDLKSPKPKFYRAFGEIEKNFDLDPYTYLARYKNANNG